MKKNQCIDGHKCILFVQDHYNPLDVCRSLGEKGVYPIVILIYKHPRFLNHCRYVSELCRVDSYEEGYNILISKFGMEKSMPFVFCSDDTSEGYLDARYNELKDKFIFYNAGEQGRIEWLQNKDNITNLGAQAGLTIPKKEILKTGDLPKTLNYPVITKVLASTMGAWKGDVHICNSEEELTEAFKQIKSPMLCMQEYIKKKGEFCFEGFAINDGKDVFLPYIFNYVRYYDNSYGHYMKVSPTLDDDFKQKILELFRLTKYNGIFEIEFMHGPDDKFYFLEINFRASTWNYAPTVGGGNLPYFWAKSTLLGRIPYEEMNLRDKPFYAMVEPEDFLNNVVKAKTISFKQWIKEWRTTECYYYYNKNDKAPYFYYWLDKINTFLLKKLHLRKE